MPIHISDTRAVFFSRSDDRMMYAAKLHPNLKTIKPFEVHFLRTDGRERNFIASVPEIGEYGYGASRSEALDDLRDTLAELYFWLEQESDRLGIAMQIVRSSLGTHLVKVEK
jgi:hypothetical protein